MDHLRRTLGEHALKRVLLLIVFSALIWIGVGFLGYAIYVALLVTTAPVWAAAITAGCLLAVPLCVLLVLSMRRTTAELRIPDAQPAQPDTEKAALALLANMAKEKPLLAVLFAGVLGAAETIRRRRE